MNDTSSDYLHVRDVRVFRRNSDQRVESLDEAVIRKSNVGLAILADADKAFAGHDLTPEAIAALTADAEVLNSEVSGFGVGMSLKTPEVLGLKLGGDVSVTTKGPGACYNTNIVKPMSGSYACICRDR